MALRDRYLKDQAVGRVAQEKGDDTTHPLLRSAADRDIRDAYFYGLVFAAFANDEQGVVDEQERVKLLEIGGLLQLSTSEVEQAIARVDSLGDADKMALIEECVRGWKDPDVVSAFLVEFETIWKIGGGSYEDLSGFYTDFEKWMDP